MDLVTCQGAGVRREIARVRGGRALLLGGVGVALLLAFGCVTPKPDVPIFAGAERIPLHVGVVFPVEFTQARHATKFARRHFDGKPFVERDSVNIGAASIELFRDGLRKVFERVVEINERQDTSAVQLVLTPRIVTSMADVQERRATSGGRQAVPLAGPSGVIARATIGYEIMAHDPAGKAVAVVTGEATGEYEPVVVVGVIPAWNFTHIVTNAFEKAQTEAFRRLVEALRASADLTAYVRAEVERQTQPAELVTEVTFRDAGGLQPNRRLDAGEQADLFISVTNRGRGTGFEVRVHMASDSPSIQVPRNFVVGHLGPGESRRLTVPVTAGLDTRDGRAAILVETLERRGYDARKVRVDLPTARLVAPALGIVAIDVNDGQGGRARGNGNGIPETGETVELVATVENRGEGPALGTTLTLVSADPAVSVVAGSVEVGTIPPGRRARGAVALTIPRASTASTLAVRLKAEDARGVGGAGYELALVVGQQRPVLAFTHRLFDGGTPQSVGNRNGIVENGETIELQVTPENTGGLEARAVRLHLAARQPGLRFQPDVIEVGTLPGQSQGAPQRFLFSVPRAFASRALDLVLTLDQEDFPANIVELPLSLRLVRPELVYTYILRDGREGSRLEQGQTAELEIRVRNQGELEARDVRLRVSPSRPGVGLSGPPEATIPNLPPGALSDPIRFGLRVDRLAPPGELPINLTLRHAEFPDREGTIALTVEEETPSVVRVEGAPPIQAIPSQPLTVPPKILVVAPKDGQVVFEESLTVAGRVAATRGVERVRVRLNGRLLPEALTRSAEPVLESGRYPTTHDFTFTILLAEGENRITVIATDVDARESEETRVVRRESLKREVWAAVIGIARYKNVPSLQYTVNDAKAFAIYLERTLGVPPQNVFLLLDEQATLQEIKRTLGITLAQKAKKEDTVLIFYAGHGAPEEDSASPDGDGLEKYLVPYDAKPGEFYATAYPMREIRSLFQRIRAERIVLLADTCYSGASGGRTLFTSRRAGGVADAFLDRISQGKGRVIITASAPNEVAQEDTQLQHGVFTYYLLEGLHGKADYDRDGLVTVDEAYQYVSAKVRDFTGQKQNPTKKGETEGQLVIGRTR